MSLDEIINQLKEIRLTTSGDIRVEIETYRIKDGHVIFSQIDMIGISLVEQVDGVKEKFVLIYNEDFA